MKCITELLKSSNVVIRSKAAAYCLSLKMNINEAEAILADSLSTDINEYLSSGKQTDLSRNIIYAMYGDKGPKSVNRFVNFAEMGIYGEEKMQDLQSLGAAWLKELLKRKRSIIRCLAY